ncbi:MAG: LysE family transporter [Bdellovibrionales bacterium]|nr:LysE family transporter [Bdellovibrionales bacterium]
MLWFFGLAFASSFFSDILSSKRAMRRVSLVSGIVLLALAVKLGIEVWGWVQAMT